MNHWSVAVGLGTKHQIHAKRNVEVRYVVWDVHIIAIEVVVVVLERDVVQHCVELHHARA